MGVLVQPQRQAVFELHDAVSEHPRVGLARVMVIRVHAAVHEDDDAIHIHPVGALNLHVQRGLAAGKRHVLSGNESLIRAGRCEHDFQIRAVRHDHMPLLGGMHDIHRFDLGRIIGGRLDPVPQTARTVVVVMGVSVHDAENAVALIEELQPVEDAVVARAALEALVRFQTQHVLNRMDFDHVHEGERTGKTLVRFSVAIAVEEKPTDVRVILLNEFLAAIVPQRDAFNLSLGIHVGDRRAAVLRAGPMDQREHILMVQRQRRARQFHARDCRHELADPEFGDVRIVGADPVVFGARCELDVFAEQIEHAAALAAGVVARGRTVAVEIAADPAGRVHGAPQRALQSTGFAGLDLQVLLERIVLRTATDRYGVLAGWQWQFELSVRCIVEIAHTFLGAVRTEMQRPSVAARLKLDLAGNPPALLAHDAASHGAGREGNLQLEFLDCGLLQNCERQLRADVLPVEAGLERGLSGRQFTGQNSSVVGATAAHRPLSNPGLDLGVRNGAIQRVAERELHGIRLEPASLGGDGPQTDQVLGREDVTGEGKTLAGLERDFAIRIAQVGQHGVPAVAVGADGHLGRFDAIGLLPEPVVDPEQGGRAVGCLVDVLLVLAAVESNVVAERDGERFRAAVLKLGGDRQRGVVFAERVGYGDLGPFGRACGLDDDGRGVAAILDLIGREIDLVPVGVEHAEFAEGEFSFPLRVKCTQLVTRVRACGKIDERPADVPDGHIGIPRRAGLSDDGGEVLISEHKVPVDGIDLFAGGNKFLPVRLIQPRDLCGGRSGSGCGGDDDGDDGEGCSESCDEFHCHVSAGNGFGRKLTRHLAPKNLLLQK